MIETFFLNLSWPNWLFALALLVLGVLAYFYYFRTLPPLSSRRRIPAIVLRAVSLGLLLFIIMEPILQIINRLTERPVIAVLLDNSASMKIDDADGMRGDSIRYVHQHLRSLQAQFGDSLNFHMYKFALNVTSLGRDSLEFETDGSNLDRALTAIVDSLSGRNLQAIALVTDGVYNQGPNPILNIQKSPAPVFTVLVGDTAVPSDVAINRVQTNQVTYVNNTLPLEVTVQQYGFEGKPVLLTVLQGSREVARKMVTLGKSGFEQKEIIDILPQTAGDFNYTVAIQPLEKEVTANNNRHTMRIRVLKSKLKVAVFSGAPNMDRHFLSYIGDQLKEYEFTFLTEKSAGRYYEQAFSQVPLDSQDLIVFHGFPTAISEAADLEAVAQSIRQRKLPVLWMINKKTRPDRFSSSGNAIPFETDARILPLDNQLVRLTSGGRLHPVTQVNSNETANDLLWRELPPVQVYKQLKMRKGAQLLAEVPQSGEESALPVCYVYRQDERKQFVLNAANFSNWHFQLQEDPSRDQFLRNLLERTIRWLVNRDDINQVQIQPLQQVYNVGEQVTFSGQVYDEFYQAISDAEVVIKVTNDTLDISDEMLAEGNGFYRQSLSGFPEGEYSYRATATRNGRSVGNRSGKFTVNPFYLEFQQIPANRLLLQQIAEKTGGKLYSAAQFVRQFPEQHFENRSQFIAREFFVWNYWHWLALLVALLGLEWFLRKRWGLL